MNDDTPSTEERERARAELKSEAAKHGSRDFWPPVNLVYERVRANRLAARVAAAEAERDDVIKRMVDAAYEHRAELAKLRAAAAPVELPASEPPEPWTWEECALANVDDAVTLSLHSVDTLWLDVGEGEEERSFALPFACIEALTGRVLALPPQEDVRGALPEGFSLRMCRSATDGPCDTYSYETRLYADRRAHVSIRPDWTIHQAGLLPGEMEAILRHHLSRPTAPRTEGGGDHGE
jgi:hypothetical protein